MKHRFYRSLLVALVIFTSQAVLFAQTYTESILYNFCSQKGCSTGSFPESNLIQANDGNFYGTTAGYSGGAGTVYRLTPAGKFTVLHTFCLETVYNCPDGATPNGIIQGSDGNLYGTVQYGGASGGGVIFKISLAGVYSVLYNFCSLADCADGTQPDVPLIEGSDGNYYGTTVLSIFKFTSAGELTHLCCADGSGFQTLTQATDGNYYGDSPLGGNSTECGGNGCGYIFRVTPAGAASDVYNFFCPTNGGDCPDGFYPQGPLVEDSGNSLYGLADGGVSEDGAGIIFKLNSSGSLSSVYTFCRGDCADGQAAQDLMIASDGNIYGATEFSGDRDEPGSGTVFRITPNSDPSASFEVVYSFNPNGISPDGFYPLSGVVQGNDGNFYGTTSEGGSGNSPGGTIYKLTVSPALPAPVQVSLSSSQVLPGKPVTATLKVLNAFSLTMQQCYAFQNGSPLGKVPGTYSSSTKLYTFSTSFTPTAAGIYNYAVTCGGVESGFATLTVGDTTQTTLAATPNPVTPSANVTLTAAVTRTTGSGTPAGSVKFSSGSTVLGSAKLNGSGVATFSASSSGVQAGTYPVTATYTGDSQDVGSASPTVNVTVQ